MLEFEGSVMDHRLKEYQEFIDALVKIRPSVEARMVMGKGWPRTPENDGINRFLSDLSTSQKKILAQIVQEARDGGIHDVLVYLADEINLRGLRVLRQDIALATEPYGTEMYYDWASRREGDDWPEHQLKDEYRSDDQG
jgi:hypothetical protein